MAVDPRKIEINPLAWYKYQASGCLVEKTPVGEGDDADTIYEMEFVISPTVVVSILVNEEGKRNLISQLTGGIALPT